MEARGAINTFCCEDCRKVYHTINLNCGVTPFICECVYCKSQKCHSMMYRFNCARDFTITVSHAWYRPTRAEFNTLHKVVQEHILQGGLIKRNLKDITSFLNDDITSDISAQDWHKFAKRTYGINILTN